MGGVAAIHLFKMDYTLRIRVLKEGKKRKLNFLRNKF